MYRSEHLMAERLDPGAFNLALRELETPDRCAQLFAETIAPLGFAAFAVGDLDLRERERSVFHIVQCPEPCWRSGMIQGKPIVETLTHRIAPFAWSDLRLEGHVPRTLAQALEIAHRAGWTEGFVVPLPLASERIGIVNVAGRRGALRPAERDALALIGLCLHGHLRRLVRHHGFALPPAGLTEREVFVVRLVAQGKADAVIGREMGVAPSTAHEFVEKAKRKLKTHSRTELVALAVSMGIADV